MELTTQLSTKQRNQLKVHITVFLERQFCVHFILNYITIVLK